MRCLMIMTISVPSAVPLAAETTRTEGGQHCHREHPTGLIFVCVCDCDESCALDAHWLALALSRRPANNKSITEPVASQWPTAGMNDFSIFLSHSLYTRPTWCTATSNGSKVLRLVHFVRFSDFEKFKNPLKNQFVIPADLPMMEHIMSYKLANYEINWWIFRPPTVHKTIKCGILTWYPVDGAQRPKNSNGPNGWKVHVLLHAHAILDGSVNEIQFKICYEIRSDRQFHFQSNCSHYNVSSLQPCTHIADDSYRILPRLTIK